MTRQVKQINSNETETLCLSHSGNRGTAWLNVENRTMAVACLIVFMAQMGTTVYLPSLPIIMTDLDILRSTVELSISVFVMGAAVPVIFFGAAADRFGRRITLSAALVLFVICSFLLAISTTKESLLVLRCLQGVGAGGSAIVARIIVRDRWTGDDLAIKLSVLSMAFITALGGGQFIGGLIGKYGSWEWGFFLMGVTGLVAALLSFTLPMVPGNPNSRICMMFPIYFRIIRRPGFLIPACVGGLGFAATIALQQMSPFVFQNHFGMDAAGHGNIGLLIGAAYLAGALTVNRMVSKKGGLCLLSSGAMITMISTALIMFFWGMGILRDQAGLVIFILLYCSTIFGQAVLFPNSMAIAVTDIKDHSAYGMALCGCLQQSIAGIAASFLACVNNGNQGFGQGALSGLNMGWTVFIFLLSGTAWVLAGKSGRLQKGQG